MKKKKEIIYIIIIFIILIYIILNTTKLNNYIIYANKLFFYKVFPFLFIMIIINELLINNNIIYYINKIFKHNGIKIYIFLMSLLSGSPTSACIIKDLYQNKIISIKEANKSLYFSYFSNPIFLISMLNLLFDFKTTIMLIIIHYIPNLIMAIIIKINPNNNYQIINEYKFNNIINKAINTSLMVLGTLTFYIVLSNLTLNLLNIGSINSTILKGLLELTQGLNEIPNLFINNKFKILLTTLFINFGGLSIHSQIKSIISDTSINYKYFLFGRLFSTITSVLLCYITAQF